MVLAQQKDNRRFKYAGAFVISTAVSLVFGGQIPVLADDAPPAKGEDEKPYSPVNPLQGLFQPQPQYPTPGTTQLFPSAMSQNMGKDADVQGRQPGTAGTTYEVPWKDPFAKEEEKKVTSVNPLEGLFQPQPQYPTPGTTQLFPTATPAFQGDDSKNPGKSPGQAGTIYQTQWKDPFAPAPAESKEKDTTNYLKGLFVPQPQYPTAGTTQMFPEAEQRNLGNDASQPGKQPGTSGEIYQGQPMADYGLPLGSLPEVKKKEEPKAPDTKVASNEGDKSKTEADKDKTEGDKDKKEADKDKKEADKDKKEADKDKKEADKDKKEADKDKKEADKDKKEADKDKKEADKDKKEADKDKKEADKDKKEGDKDKTEGDKDKTEGDKDKKDEKSEAEKKKEELKPLGPLNEAAMLINSSRFQECITLLTNQIKKSPNNPQAFYIRAVAYVKMRRYQDAAADYNQVVKITPTGPVANLARTGLSKLHF